VIDGKRRRIASILCVRITNTLLVFTCACKAIVISICITFTVVVRIDSSNTGVTVPARLLSLAFALPVLWSSATVPEKLLSFALELATLEPAANVSALLLSLALVLARVSRY